MKIHVLAVVGSAIGFVTPALAAETTPNCIGPQVACQQIISLIKTYADALNTKDAGAAAALFASDAVVMSTGPIVSGRAAIESWQGGVIKAGEANVALTVVQIYVAGDLAGAVGEWSATFPGQNDTTMPVHGHWGGTEVFNGGTWQIRMWTPNIVRTTSQ